METFWKFETQSHNPVAGILLRNDTHVANIQHWECGETDSEKTTKYGREIERKLNSYDALLAACKAALQCQLSGLDENTVDDLESAIKTGESGE